MKGFSTLLLIIFGLPLFAQQVEKSKIEISNASFLEGVKINGKSVSKLIGNVAFKQGDVSMTCDSAYFYDDENSVEAFGHVYVLNNKSGVQLFGDKLRYQGNTKTAVLNGNIRLIDKSTELKTSELFYDLNTDIGHYPQRGIITDKENKLRSRHGYYYAKSKEFFFKDSVVLSNPEYTMYSDTLRYNTISKITYFYGPSYIISKENTIYCENGWYDTQKELSRFAQNAYLQGKTQTLKGDSLYYDRKKGKGKAVGNVNIKDSIQKVIISGDVGYYFRQEDKATVSGNSLLTKIFEKDSLFLKADTLMSVYDTIAKNRSIRAYKHVRIYKQDLQGLCDSLAYNSSDSTIQLFEKPILWSSENQLTAKSVRIQLADNKIDKMYLLNDAFIISSEDSSRYNQIKGRDMTAYFSNNALDKIKVEGNGQSIYFARDEKKKFVGVNQAECSNMLIYIKDNKVDRLDLFVKPEAKFHPMGDLSAKELLLKGFKWYIKLRPNSKADL